MELRIVEALNSIINCRMSMAEWEHCLGQSALAILVLEEVALTLNALGLVTMLPLVATLMTVEAFKGL